MRNLRPKYHKPTKGFTIVEVLIVTVVTALIFISTITIIGGQQNKTEFTVAVQEFQTRLQQLIDDVANGYYPLSNGFTCTGGPNGPIIQSAATANRGSNPDCIFLGKVVQMAVGAPNSATANVYPLVGLRLKSGSVPPQVSQSFSDAKPVLFAKIPGGGLGSVDVDNYETAFLQNGVTVAPFNSGKGGMYFNDIDTAANQTYAMVFSNSFGQYDTANNLISQGQQVSLFAVDRSIPDGRGDPLLGNTNGVSDIDSAFANPVTNIHSVFSVEICLVSGGGAKSALVTVGPNTTAVAGNGAYQIGVEVKIFSSPDCS